MFALQQCGYRFVHPEGIVIDRPQGAPFYVFVYYRTPCEFETPGGMVPCEGQFILMEPGVRHRYRSTCAPYINDWVHFDIADAQGKRFMDELRIARNVPVPLADSRAVDSAVKALEALEAFPPQWQHAIADAHLTALLSQLSRSPAPSFTGTGETAHRYHAAFSALRAELYRMPRQGTSVQALAGRAGLSASRFHHLYRQLFGRTVGEDIAAGRLQRAKYLLKNSAAPLGVIAEGSGYTNETHLCRQFRRHMGMTPGQYRRLSP